MPQLVGKDNSEELSNGVNISFKSIENGVVNFYAPVFNSIKYRIAKNISNYDGEFNSRIAEFKDTTPHFRVTAF